MPVLDRCTHMCTFPLLGCMEAYFKPHCPHALTSRLHNLQYHIGGVIAERNSLLVTKPETLRGRFNLDLRVNTEVTSIDRGAKTVEIRDTTTGATKTEVCRICRAMSLPTMWPVVNKHSYASLLK